jgi:hypothetical protein
VNLGEVNINTKFSFNTYDGTDAGQTGTAPQIIVGTCE